MERGGGVEELHEEDSVSQLQAVLNIVTKLEQAGQGGGGCVIETGRGCSWMNGWRAPVKPLTGKAGTTTYL